MPETDREALVERMAEAMKAAAIYAPPNVHPNHWRALARAALAAVGKAYAEAWKAAIAGTFTDEVAADLYESAYVRALAVVEDEQEKDNELGSLNRVNGARGDSNGDRDTHTSAIAEQGTSRSVAGERV